MVIPYNVAKVGGKDYPFVICAHVHIYVNITT